MASRTSVHAPLPVRRARRWLRGITGLATALATLAWIPCLGAIFSEEPRVLGAALARGQRTLLGSPQLQRERAAMRQANPEYDFMGRTFAGLTFANQALADRGRRRQWLAALDDVIDTTSREAGAGTGRRFLMSYVNHAPFRDPDARSLFIDGELALLLAARQLIEPDPRHEAPLRARIGRVLATMQAGPVLSGESYPDECWTFCNTTALAAVRLYDAGTGEDHSAFLRAWVQMARARLIDPSTGMLVSSYTYAGEHRDVAEGSTLWLVAYNLLLIDPKFAREQYALGKQRFGHSLGGFGWASEWSTAGHLSDVDSGPVIPVLDISPASSGLALVAAAGFGDAHFLGQLTRSLNFSALPTEVGDGMRLALGNQVANAVFAYAFTLGPLWKRAGSIDAREGGAL